MPSSDIARRAQRNLEAIDTTWSQDIGGAMWKIGGTGVALWSVTHLVSILPFISIGFPLFFLLFGMPLVFLGMYLRYIRER